MAVEWLEYDSVNLGKKIQYRLDINAAEFVGRAGFPWLVMAANVGMSLSKLQEIMYSYGYYRPASWISRRRWIFFDAEYVRNTGGRPRNADGQDARAYRIMEQHPHVSARQLAYILKKHGIKRSKDWVLRHRVH